MTALAEAALAYAANGAEVFPLHTPTGQSSCSCRNRKCENQGKHPRTLRGHLDATADLEQVAIWWRLWPTANIGLRPAEDQVVLDVDPRHHGDVQLAAMQERYLPLPATRTARTGSGGLHLWFRARGEFRGQLCPGIDIKTRTGFLVAPPSQHRLGGTYSWTNCGAIAEIPDYLRGLLTRPAPMPDTGESGELSPAALAGLVRKVADAPTGRRNTLLNWACWRAVQRGCTDLAPLVAAGESAGLDRAAAEATAASVLRRFVEVAN